MLLFLPCLRLLLIVTIVHSSTVKSDTVGYTSSGKLLQNEMFQLGKYNCY